MNFPTYVYQGGVFPKNGRIVKDVKETLLALEEATKADKDDNVLERFVEKVKEVVKPKVEIKKEEIKKPKKGSK